MPLLKYNPTNDLIKKIHIPSEGVAYGGPERQAKKNKS